MYLLSHSILIDWFIVFLAPLFILVIVRVASVLNLMNLLGSK